MNAEEDARFVFESLLTVYDGTMFEVELATGLAFARWPFFADDLQHPSVRFIDEFCRVYAERFGVDTVDAQVIKDRYLTLMMD